MMRLRASTRLMELPSSSIFKGSGGCERKRAGVRSEEPGRVTSKDTYQLLAK